jgi:hypothetical protein
MLLSDVCVPVFKILYRLTDIAMAHAGVFIFMSKSCMNIQCGDFLHKRKFCCCTLLNQHVRTNHFLTLYYNYTTGSSDVIYIPLSDNTLCIAQCSTVWPLLTIS